MRNRILGIAGLTLRQAVRSRFVICLFVLMLSLLIGFSLTIKGDGTAAGRLQMLLSYAIGVVGVVLGMAVLWLACGSFSTEIENRRLHLVLVKPVRNVELWIGKWLGIVTVAMLMLAVAGVFLAAAGQVALRRTLPGSVDGRAVRRQILAARHVSEAERIPDQTGRVRWHVVCPPVIHSAAAVAQLRYQFVSPLRDLPAVQMHWEVTGPDGALRFEADCEAHIDGVNRLDVPVDRLQAGERMTLAFLVRPTEGASAQYVTFHPDHPVEMLIPSGGFGANLVRTLLLMFCRVALLAALGVTVGTLFTFPVAVFAAASIVVATLFTQFVAFSSAPERQAGHHSHGEEGLPEWVEWTGDHLAHGIRFAVAPVLRYRVRGRLADGVSVPWSEVHEAAGILIFVYGGALCALACATLRRREIALPV